MYVHNLFFLFLRNLNDYKLISFTFWFQLFDYTYFADIILTKDAIETILFLLFIEMTLSRLISPGHTFLLHSFA